MLQSFNVATSGAESAAQYLLLMHPYGMRAIYSIATIFMLTASILIFGNKIHQYFLTFSMLHDVAFNTSTPPNNAGPNATIDQSSLNASSANPTIKGTFTNTGGIEVVLATGTLPLDGALSNAAYGLVWDERSDHSGGVLLNGTSTGTYSDKIFANLQRGTYKLGIYQIVLYYPQTDVNLAKDTRHLLVSGILVETNSVSR